MRDRILTVLLCVLLLLTACSQKQSRNDMPEIINTLTSDQYEGRRAGTKGNQLAAEYIAQQFKKLGLEPIDTDYFHEYKQKILLEDKQKNVFKLIFKDGSEKNLEHGKDYIQYIEGLPLIIEGPVTLDFYDKDIAQKVFVGDDINYLQAAYDKRAKGILLVEKPFIHFGFPPNAVLDYGYPCLKITQEVYDLIESGSVREVSISSDYEAAETTCSNVIGIIPGKDRKKAVVLSAHFDHLGKTGSAIYRGAIDNASGVAVLVETARKLMDSKELYGCDIVICAFNGEEWFLQGSNDFVDDLKTRYEALYNINVDCVGKAEGGHFLIKGDTELSKPLYEDFHKYIEKRGLQDRWQDLKHSQTYSDHFSFIQENFAAISISQETLTGVHTITDTAQVVDYNHLSLLSEVLFEFLMSNKEKIF